MTAKPPSHAKSARRPSHKATPGRDVPAVAPEHFAISDLAREFAITPRTIRFYESRGLIAPERVGTKRLYSRRDRARLMLILRGRNLGFSVEDVGDYLALYDADPNQIAQARLLLDKVTAAIADLETKRADTEKALTELDDIRQRCIAHLTTTATPK